jgi:hypothetical protein
MYGANSLADVVSLAQQGMVTVAIIDLAPDAGCHLNELRSTPAPGTLGLTSLIKDREWDGLSLFLKRGAEELLVGFFPGSYPCLIFIFPHTYCLQNKDPADHAGSWLINSACSSVHVAIHNPPPWVI